MSSETIHAKEKLLREKLEKDPADWDTRQQLAHLLYDQGAFGKAADLIWEADKIPSTDLDLAFAARILAKEQPRKAIRLLTAVLEHNKGKAVQNMGMANALLCHGMVLQAARFYGAALEADPSLVNPDLEHFILWTDDEQTLWGDFKNRRPKLGELPWMARDPMEALKLTSRVSLHTTPIAVPNLKPVAGEELRNDLYQQEAKLNGKITPPPAVTIAADQVDPKHRRFDSTYGAATGEPAAKPTAPAAPAFKPAADDKGEAPAAAKPAVKRLLIPGAPPPATNTSPTTPAASPPTDKPSAAAPAAPPVIFKTAAATPPTSPAASQNTSAATLVAPPPASIAVAKAPTLAIAPAKVETNVNADPQTKPLAEPEQAIDDARKEAESLMEKAREQATAQAEALKAKAEEEAKAQAEALKAKAEEEAKAQAEALKAKAEEEAKAAAEQARKQAEQELAAIKARSEAESKAAIEEARKTAEAEAAQLKARLEAEAREQLEKELAASKEKAKQEAEAEAQRVANEAKQRAEEEARKTAEAEAQAAKAANQAQLQAEEELKQIAEKARQQALAEAEALKAEIEAARKAAQAEIAALRAQTEEALKAANEAKERALAEVQAAQQAQTTTPAPAAAIPPSPATPPPAAAIPPSPATPPPAEPTPVTSDVPLIPTTQTHTQFLATASYTTRVELSGMEIPKTVVDENGVERPLTDDEIAAYKAMQEDMIRARAAARAAAREQRLKAAASGVPLPATTGRPGEWYFIMNNEAVGPVLAEELQDKIADHTISPPIKMIWTTGMQRWTPVYDCPNLWNKQNHLHGNR